MVTGCSRALSSEAALLYSRLPSLAAAQLLNAAADDSSPQRSNELRHSPVFLLPPPVQLQLGQTLG